MTFYRYIYNFSITSNSAVSSNRILMFLFYYRNFSGLFAVYVISPAFSAYARPGSRFAFSRNAASLQQRRVCVCARKTRRRRRRPRPKYREYEAEEERMCAPDATWHHENDDGRGEEERRTRWELGTLTFRPCSDRFLEPRIEEHSVIDTRNNPYNNALAIYLCTHTTYTWKRIVDMAAWVDWWKEKMDLCGRCSI